MATGAPVAMAIGVGYVLGRSHKLRWALLLGTAAATGRLGGLSTQALERGTEVLRSSPELARLTDTATGLLQAGRTAAVSALTSRAESMTEALGDKAGQLGSVGEKVAEGAKPRRGGKGTEETRRRGEDSRDVEDEYEEEEQDEYDEEGTARDDQDAEYEEDTVDRDEDEPQPSARGGRQGRDSVVRRTGSRR
jgi:hypothetical protein